MKVNNIYNSTTVLCIHIIAAPADHGKQHIGESEWIYTVANWAILVRDFDVAHVRSMLDNGGG